MREAGVFERLKAKGEAVFAQVSSELMANPRFMKAMEAAFKGKAKLDEAVAQALKSANIPTRTEFKRALKRLEGLEAQIEELKAELARASARSKTPRRPRTRPATPRRPRGSGESGPATEG